MKPVRILLISPAHPPTDPRIVGKHAPTLAGVYEVTCLLPNAAAGQSGGIRFVRLPFFGWLGWRLLLVHPLILGHIIWLRPALLHIYMPELLPIALLCRLFGVKVVYDVQENLRLKFDRKPHNNHFIFQWAFGVSERLARHYCYHIFTEHSYLATYPGLRLPHAVIHNYPDRAFFDGLPRVVPADLPGENGPHLLYVGVISPDRGLDTMIQMLTLLTATYPTIRLHLFGRSTISPARLRALPGYAEVAASLVFYGHTDPGVAYAHANRYAAGLALLKPVGDYPGSYPTKLFEYMALGLPVVTSDFPLYRAVVEPDRCGYCVDPANARQVASVIARLLGNPDEAKRMGQRGKQLVQQAYNWQKEAEELLRLYQKIVLT